MPYFENWVNNASKMRAEQILVGKGNNWEVWGKPWCDELMEKIETNGDIEEVINAKNQKLYDEFAADEITPLEDTKTKYQEELSRLEEKSSRAKIFNQKLDDFEKDVEILVSKYPPERQLYVKNLLGEYFKTGEFVERGFARSLTGLRRPPEGFFNKIRQGSKIKDANRYLDAFIDKYQTINLRTELDEMSKTFSVGEVDPLKSKFESIADRDKEKTALWSKKFTNQENIWQSQISEKQQDIQKAEAKIEKSKTSFNESKLLQEEDETIRNFAKEIRDDIQNPKQYKVSDYIECLENMPDDEKVMFDLRLPTKRQKGIEQILKYNGLQTGDDTKQWLLRKEIDYGVDRFDSNDYEIFSPLMTAKEAKEVMPKLVADFEKAHIFPGLVVPMTPKDVFKDVSKQDMPQEMVDDGFHKLMVMARYQNNKKSPYFVQTEEQKEALRQYLGVSSLDELPPVYGSIDELKQQFPKDKYLFSGTMASDDYCQLSGRVGRNGKVYATPDIAYASAYDGVIDIGQGSGRSATGDAYVSTVVGQIDEEPIRAGFINVYEQSSEDKFFENFGMECYHHSKEEDMKIGQGESVVSVDYQEKEKKVFVKRQRAVNSRLTKDQAMNGYVTIAFQEHDGKAYSVVQHNAETYVTPEKNPLKAKIMHIAYDKDPGANGEFYIQVPDNPNGFVKYLLNSRQADMTDTFKSSHREDVLARFQKQKEEFKQGIVHQARTPDFLEQKQARLQSGGKGTEDKFAAVQEVKTEKTSVKMENPAAEKIQQLRGVENSGAQAVVEAGEKVAEKTAVRAGAEAVKSSEGIVSAIAKADNAVNQAIDKTIDKGSELLNNNAVGRAYEKAAEKVADTKVMKAVEKTTAKVAEKAAQTTVGKAVVKAAAKTAGSAVGKSLLKKIPLVSLGAGAYFAWDRLKEGDWKGACGEMASGALGCLPGVGTAASAAIDVGLAAKDIKTAVDESKGAAAAGQPTEVEAAGTSSGSKTEEDKKKAKEICRNADSICRKFRQKFNQHRKTTIIFFSKKPPNRAEAELLYFSLLIFPVLVLYPRIGGICA